MQKPLIAVIGDVHHHIGLAAEGLTRIEMETGRRIGQVTSGNPRLVAYMPPSKYCHHRPQYHTQAIIYQFHGDEFVRNTFCHWGCTVPDICPPLPTHPCRPAPSRVTFRPTNLRFRIINPKAAVA